MSKQQHMKELLNNKFKHEKASLKRMNGEYEERLYDVGKRAERFNQTKIRKEMEEQKLQKRRN